MSDVIKPMGHTLKQARISCDIVEEGVTTMAMPMLSSAIGVMPFCAARTTWDCS